MRIIRGRNKGKILSAPKNLPVRPTTDMAKEGIFNIIENYLEWDSSAALDLFCGTGNISFEMASRGCSDVTSVDSHLNCIKYINKIASELNYDEIHTKVSDAITFLKRNKRLWDFIFADPPYDFDNYNELIDHIPEKLKKNGVFILEHGGQHNFNECKNFDGTRRYGSVRITIFRSKPTVTSA